MRLKTWALWSFWLVSQGALTACAQESRGGDAVMSATLVTRTILHSNDPAFGGLSALAILENGREMLAVSDRGYWVRGVISRDELGAVVGVQIEDIQPIRHGKKRVRGVGPNDSEGLAIDREGRYYVSFEGQHRIGRYDTLDSEEQAVVGAPEFQRLQVNSGLEALAMNEQGELFAIPERSGHLERPFPIYQLKDGVWRVAYSLERMGDFLVVGADFGPDGALYVLERRFTGFGFLSQVRRIDLVSGQASVILNSQGRFGNLEGLSLWENAQGETMLSMVSDNNYHFFLSSDLVEYRLDQKIEKD